MDVSSAQEASILSNEYTWTILQILHASGTQGLTALELHKAVEKVEGTTISKSKIYDLLKRLYEIQWLHKIYDQKVKSHRYTLVISWGDVGLEDKFYGEISEKLKKNIQTELLPIFDKYLKNSVEIISNDKNLKKWLPGKGETWYCKKCDANHEAEEFVTGLLELAIEEYLNSDYNTKFMIENKYANEEYE